jgi:hypothetical protein
MGGSRAAAQVASPGKIRRESWGVALSSFKVGRCYQPSNRKEREMIRRGRRAALKKVTVTLGLLVIMTTGGWAFGQPPGGGHHQGPPPEALTACEGKSPGDTVQIQTPHGQTIDGTCKEMPDGKLVAVPQGGPQGRMPGPPPEAFQACEGKKVGEAVQIQTPRGDMVRATCRLVAVPQS